MGVPVIGLRTDDFPAFYCRKSGYSVDYNAPDEETVAKVMKAKWDLGLKGEMCIRDRAHPVRLKLFRYIMQCNKSMETVCNKDLVANFDYAQATISQHVKKLVDAGLIEVKKQDKFSYYYANLGVLMQYIDITKKYSIIG